MLVDIKGKDGKGWNVGHDLKVSRHRSQKNLLWLHKSFAEEMNQCFVPSQFLL